MACESSQQSPHSTNERIRRANIIQIPQPMLLLPLFLSPLSVKFEKFDFFLLTTFTRILISASHSARHSLFLPWMTLLGGGEGYKASLSPASHISEFFSSETFHFISDLPSWQHTIKFLEEVQDDVVDDVKLKRNLHKKKISVELKKVSKVMTASLIRAHIRLSSLRQYFNFNQQQCTPLFVFVKAFSRC